MSLPRFPVPRLPSGRALDWREPEPWIATLLILLVVIVLGRHPIAKLLGTESPNSGSATVTVPRLAGGLDTGALPARAPAQVPAMPTQPVVTHAPVDPFRALVTTTGGVRTPAVLPTTIRPGSHGTAGHRGHAAAGATGSCSASYVVRQGDTLWGISHRFAARTGHADWAQLYAANRAAIGSDPGLLRVGTRICLGR